MIFKQSTIQKLFVLYLLTVLFLHVMPTSGVEELGEYFLGIRGDHWLHGIMFFPLGIFMPITLKKWHFSTLLLLLATCACFETIQYFLPYRFFDFWDIVADSTGATIGLSICLKLQNKLN